MIDCIKLMMKYLCVLLGLLAISNSIAPRQLAPDFSALAVMPDNSFATLKLSSFIGKYVVLVFYPFDFTYVCPTEIISYSERANDFKSKFISYLEIGAEVIAVSVDSHFSHLAWKNTPREKGGLGQINIPLLADITKEISRNYGVLVEDPTDGLNGATLRGLFVIDRNGKIRSITINDEQVGRNVD